MSKGNERTTHRTAACMHLFMCLCMDGNRYCNDKVTLFSSSRKLQKQMCSMRGPNIYSTHLFLAHSFLNLVHKLDNYIIYCFNAHSSAVSKLGLILSCKCSAQDTKELLPRHSNRQEHKLLANQNAFLYKKLENSL